MTTNDERAQIRAEAVREAALWLNNHVGDLLYGEDQPDDDGHTAARVNAISFAAKDMERALLRPDPAEASEPLEADPYEQYRAAEMARVEAAHGEVGTLHEPTVRVCIALMNEKQSAWTLSKERYQAAGNFGPYLGVPGYSDAARALEALLPKPDPAAELVEAFASDTRDEGGSEIVRTPNTEWQFAHYTRWLIDTGRLKP